MKTQTKNTVILVQPQMGFLGEFVKHIPLSLLYVASGLIKNNFEVKILDCRVNHKNWEKNLKNLLTDNVIFVGVTVMSGAPVAYGIEISKLVKSKSNIPVVWGGPHPTVIPRQALNEDYVDFTVSGSGVQASLELARNLAGVKSDKKIDDIIGLGYKRNGEIHLNPTFKGFEHVHYSDIPYWLIENSDLYGQIGSNERIFPIYSAYGCPYNCSFCVSPFLYKDFKKRWFTLEVKEVADHIEYLYKKYKATQIYFYDDDSFVSLDHVSNIIKEVKKRNFKIKMSFRGARVNELLKMDEEYLKELAEAGTEQLHIGMESGSQRVLDLFNKGIKVEDIVEANKKISKSKSIIAAYNWIVGTPTETEEDLAESRKLIMRLINDNPRCIIFRPNKFHPYLGTEMAKLADEHGYRQPSRLEDWKYEEAEGSNAQPWYSKDIEQMIKMLQIVTYFIDNKPAVILKSNSLKNTAIKLISFFYKPLARFRFKNGFTKFLVEYSMYQFFVSKYRK